MKFKQLLDKIGNYKNARLYYEDILSPYIRYDISPQLYLQFNKDGNVELKYTEQVNMFGESLFSLKMNIVLIPNCSIDDMDLIISIINTSKSKNLNNFIKIVNKETK